ncbi:MAG TPA: hypothetical protein VGL34_28710 [Steroidobacteraceae bacterium]|jgi:hypothetical protein
MQLRPLLQIQTIMKAMSEDIIPALDQTNQLAVQSAHLTIGTLALMAQHLPLEYRYDCDELRRLIECAKSLGAQLKPEGGATVAAELIEAGKVGSDVLSRARAEPSEIVDAVRRLRVASANAVSAAYAAGDEAAQAAVEKTVLSMSKQQLLRDRSWLLMQGWEPDPKSVPGIAELLTSK